MLLLTGAKVAAFLLLTEAAAFRCNPQESQAEIDFEDSMNRVHWDTDIGTDKADQAGIVLGTEICDVMFKGLVCDMPSYVLCQGGGPSGSLHGGNRSKAGRKSSGKQNYDWTKYKKISKKETIKLRKENHDIGKLFAKQSSQSQISNKDQDVSSKDNSEVFEERNIKFFKNGCFATAVEKISSANFTCAIDSILAVCESILFLPDTVVEDPIMEEARKIQTWRVKNNYDWTHSLRNDFWELLADMFPEAIRPLGRVDAAVDTPMSHLGRKWPVSVQTKFTCSEARCGAEWGDYKYTFEDPLLLYHPDNSVLNLTEYTLEQLVLDNINKEIRKLAKLKLKCHIEGCVGFAVHSEILGQEIKFSQFLFLHFPVLGFANDKYLRFEDSCVLQEDLEIDGVLFSLNSSLLSSQQHFFTITKIDGLYYKFDNMLKSKTAPCYKSFCEAYLDRSSKDPSEFSLNKNSIRPRKGCPYYAIYENKSWVENSADVPLDTILCQDLNALCEPSKKNDREVPSLVTDINANKIKSPDHQQKLFSGNTQQVHPSQPQQGSSSDLQHPNFGVQQTRFVIPNQDRPGVYQHPDLGDAQQPQVLPGLGVSNQIRLAENLLPVVEEPQHLGLGEYQQPLLGDCQHSGPEESLLPGLTQQPGVGDPPQPVSRLTGHQQPIFVEPEQPRRHAESLISTGQASKNNSTQFPTDNNVTSVAADSKELFDLSCEVNEMKCGRDSVTSDHGKVEDISKDDKKARSLNLDYRLQDFKDLGRYQQNNPGSFYDHSKNAWFCATCQNFSNTGRSAKHWVEIGVVMQGGDAHPGRKFKKHFESKFHHQSVEMKMAFKNAHHGEKSKTIVEMLKSMNPNIDQSVAENREIMKIMFKTVHYQVKHFMSNATYTSLLHHIADCGSEVLRKFIIKSPKNATYFSVRTFDKILDVLDSFTERPLLQSLRQASSFCIYHDETTDIRQHSEAAIYVMFAHNNVYAEHFIGIINMAPLLGLSAEKMYTSTYNFFDQKGVDLKNSGASDLDGCNVNQGVRAGFKLYFKYHNPHHLHQSCNSHQLALIPKRKITESRFRIVANADKIMINLYTLFRNGSVKTAIFENSQIMLEHKVLKIICPSYTRWLSHEACFKRILEVYEPTLMTLSQLFHERDDLEAQGILMKIIEPDFILTAMMLADLLGKWSLNDLITKKRNSSKLSRTDYFLIKDLLVNKNYTPPTFFFLILLLTSCAINLKNKLIHCSGVVKFLTLWLQKPTSTVDLSAFLGQNAIQLALKRFLSPRGL